MVEVVGPDGVELRSSPRQWTDNPDVPPIVLGNQHDSSPLADCLARLRADFRKQVDGTLVVNLLSRVQAKSIQVILDEPVTRVLDNELADPLGIRAVKIEGVSPRRL